MGFSIWVLPEPKLKIQMQILYLRGDPRKPEEEKEQVSWERNGSNKSCTIKQINHCGQVKLNMGNSTEYTSESISTPQAKGTGVLIHRLPSGTGEGCFYGRGRPGHSLALLAALCRQKEAPVAKESPQVKNIHWSGKSQSNTGESTNTIGYSVTA